MPGWLPGCSGLLPACQPAQAGLDAGPLGAPAGMPAGPGRAGCRVTPCSFDAPELAFQSAYAGLYAGLAGMAASLCRLGGRPRQSSPPLTCPTGILSWSIYIRPPPTSGQGSQAN